MNESAWADYVEWSGLDEERLARIMRDREDDSSPGDDTHRDRDSSVGTGSEDVVHPARSARSGGASTTAGSGHHGAGEQRDA
ncbi:MAG: hypothetical protein V7706_14905 [Dietzia psychralcaliphila]